MEKPRTTRKSPRHSHPNREPGPETMSSWLERQASSHNVQLAATALLSGVAVAGLIYGSQTIRRKAAVDELKASIPELSENHHADLVSRTTINKSFFRLTENSEFNVDHLSEAHELWSGLTGTGVPQGRCSICSLSTPCSTW